MVAIAGDRFPVRGIDVLSWYDLSTLKPDAYIVAHMMGNADRASRRKMYFCMLKQGLQVRNDILAEHGLKKCLSFVRCERETVLEPAKGLREFLLAARIRDLEGRVLKLCRGVLFSKRAYSEKEYQEYSVKKMRYSLRCPKTTLLAIKTVVEILTNCRWEPEKSEENEKLVSDAYATLYSLYIGEAQRKALKIDSLSLYSNPSIDFKQVVLDCTKHGVNGMSLEAVSYFLKKYPHMPRELLQLFRIEYARKGGAFDLSAPPIKD